MSGECDSCSEHCMDCKCKDKTILPTSTKWSTRMQRLKKAGLIGMKDWKETVEVEENILLELIYWARRYCDGRSTYVPSRFNQLYENIVNLNPKLKEKDQFDQTLMDKGKYWPYAQDGMFNERTGAYEARPMKTRIQ